MREQDCMAACQPPGRIVLEATEVALARSDCMVMLFLCLALPLSSMAGTQWAPATAHADSRILQDDGVWWFKDGSGKSCCGLTGAGCGRPAAPDRRAL